MARSIITARDLSPATFTAAGPQAELPVPDSYRDKLIKYIPAEVVSFYISADLLIRNSTSTTPNKQLFDWVVFGFLLLMTPVYLCKLQGVKRWFQLFLSTLAFAVWVFAMGGPFLHWEWIVDNRIVGGLVLMAYTFVIPLIDPDLFAKHPT